MNPPAWLAQLVACLGLGLGVCRFNYHVKPIVSGEDAFEEDLLNKPNPLYRKTGLLNRNDDDGCHLLVKG